MSDYSNYSIREFALLVKKVLRFIGLGTFSVKNDKVHVTAFDLLCLFANIFFGFFVLYLSFSTGFYLQSNVKILALGRIITMICGSIVTLISIVCVFCNRHRIWDVILILEDVMVKFRRIQVYPNFKRYIIMYITFAVISAFLIVLGLVIMFILLGYETKLDVLVIFGYLSASFAAMMGWSSMFHLSIYLRLNLINQTIK